MCAIRRARQRSKRCGSAGERDCRRLPIGACERQSNGAAAGRADVLLAAAATGGRHGCSSRLRGSLHPVKMTMLAALPRWPRATSSSDLSRLCKVSSSLSSSHAAPVPGIPAHSAQLRARRPSRAAAPPPPRQSPRAHRRPRCRCPRRPPSPRTAPTARAPRAARRPPRPAAPLHPRGDAHSRHRPRPRRPWPPHPCRSEACPRPPPASPHPAGAGGWHHRVRTRWRRRARPDPASFCALFPPTRAASVSKLMSLSSGGVAGAAGAADPPRRGASALPARLEGLANAGPPRAPPASRRSRRGGAEPLPAADADADELRGGERAPSKRISPSILEAMPSMHRIRNRRSTPNMALKSSHNVCRGGGGWRSQPKHVPQNAANKCMFWMWLT